MHPQKDHNTLGNTLVVMRLLPHWYLSHFSVTFVLPPSSCGTLPHPKRGLRVLISIPGCIHAKDIPTALAGKKKFLAHKQ